MNRTVFLVIFVAMAALCVCEARRTCRGGEHDLWTDCGSACEPSCEEPGPRPCTLQCIINTCRCEKTYLRRADGLCVKPEDCYEE